MKIRENFSLKGVQKNLILPISFWPSHILKSEGQIHDQRPKLPYVCQLQWNSRQKGQTARTKLIIMNNWSKTKNQRKISNQYPGLILSENVYNASLFAMYYVNLKIRHSQNVSTKNISKKCEKMHFLTVFRPKRYQDTTGQDQFFDHW